MTNQQPWPANVVARYLTVGGATADVIHDATDKRPVYFSVTHTVRGACTGELCEASFTYGGECTYYPDADPIQDDEDFRRYVAEVQVWAQGHAEKCRAMPRPYGGQR